MTAKCYALNAKKNANANGQAQFTLPLEKRAKNAAVNVQHVADVKCIALSKIDFNKKRTTFVVLLFFYGICIGYTF